MIIVFLDICAVSLVAVQIGPAFLIDRVYRKDLDLPAVDEIRDGVDHAEIFKVGAFGVLRRIDKKRTAPVAVDQNVHIPVQPAAVMGKIFSLH